MFFHNLKYTLKVLLKNKSLIFWTLGFPFILGTFFYMAFGNLTDNMEMEPFDIAVVNAEEPNVYLTETLKEVSNKDSDNYLFNIKYVDVDEANSLLDDDKISGYIYSTSDETKLVVRDSGINQTIVKYVIDEVNTYQDMVTSIVTYESSKGKTIDYQQIINNITKAMNENPDIVKNQSKKNLSVEVIEFYVLIAMACMYGGIIGLFVINNTVANVSKRAARVSIAPVKKQVTVISSALAGYIVVFVEILLLLAYTSLGLGIDYGTDIGRIIVISLIGSLAGLSLGMLLGTASKIKPSAKEGITISLTMVGSFFAGMYGMTMKYITDTNMPIINKINPVAMITDGLYSLYYYEGLDRYYYNVISLVIFSMVMLLLTWLSLRRQTYDSI